MTDSAPTPNPATWVISAGRDRTAGQTLNVAPELASNFFLSSPGVSEPVNDRIYTRSGGTSTSAALEEIVGGLDGGRALVFSSGMAAVSAVLHRLPAGAHLVVPDDPYHGTSGLAAEGEAQGRWTVDRLDQADTAAWVQAAKTADLLWLESPANPLITVADLPTICAAPRKDGCLVAVDSTFATPLNQQPLDYGADVVMHSATKFVGGHSDLLAGYLVTRDDELYDELHTRRLLYGGSIGAMEAFLAVRGARTLALRMDRAQDNASELARRLEAHAEVSMVRYPGLESHPTHGVATSFMTRYGAMMSFDTTGTGERATAVCEAAELICHATSLGGVESTMERRASVPGQETMPTTLIRFSVGCEDVEDIWRDLDQALTRTST